MKTYLWTLASFLIVITGLNAQLAPGSPAPDFTLPIMSKEDPADPPLGIFTLSDETDAGKSVCLFFMSSWCGPCWNFAQEGVLDTIFNRYGQGGTDDTRVVMIEADLRTNRECLFNLPECSFGISRGDWTELPYMILEMDSMEHPKLDSLYGVEFYPSLMVVSPDMRVYEVEDRTIEDFESWILESFKLDVSGSAINANCGSDGAVVLLVIGGHGLLSYEWSNGATTKDLVAVGAGSYSVTVTDENGYTVEAGPFVVSGASDTITIDTVQLVEPTCSGSGDGVIEVAVSGGTAPYSILWNTGDTVALIEGLEAGSYILTVTDSNMCVATDTFDLAEPSALTLNYLTEPERCLAGNGRIEAAASGGVPPYEYSIGGAFTGNPLFRNLKAGIYNVLVRDSLGCEASEQVLVDSILPPVADAGSEMYIGCGVDSVTLDGSNSSVGQDISYLWTSNDGNILSGDTSLFPVVNGLGRYTLFVTDNATGCVATDNVWVSRDTTVNAVVTGDTSLNCAVTQLTLDGSASTQGAHILYQWSTIGGNILSGANSVIIELDAPGVYEFVVQDTMIDCSDTVHVTVISDNVAPVVTVRTPDTLGCRRDSVILDATGSSFGAQFEVEWSTMDGNFVRGENSLRPVVNAPGSYTLTILNTANHCESTASVEVFEIIDSVKANFDVLIDGLDVQFADMSEGNPYLWIWEFGDGNVGTGPNPGHSYAVPAVYVVCLTVEGECGEDQACKTVRLGTGEPLMISEILITQNLCYGDQNGIIDLTVSGGFTPYKFLWSTGDTTEDISNLSAGLYNVTITDSIGATLTLGYVVLEPDELMVSDTSIVDESAAGASNGAINLDIKGGVEPYEYLWSDGSTESSLEGVSAGSYSLTVTDANGCSKVFGPFEVGVGTTISTLTSVKAFEISPNPAGEYFRIEVVFSDIGNRWVTLGSVTGEEFKKWKVSSKQFEAMVDVSHLSAGIYFVRIVDESGVAVRKLLINRE